MKRSVNVEREGNYVYVCINNQCPEFIKTGHRNVELSYTLDGSLPKAKAICTSCNNSLTLVNKFAIK